MARDKASLDIFWLKDDSLDNLDDLPPPDVLQQEIIEHLEAALAAFRDVAVSLPPSASKVLVLATSSYFAFLAAPLPNCKAAGLLAAEG